MRSFACTLLLAATLIALACASPLRAETVREIRILGATADIDFAPLLRGKTGELSKKEIEALGALVTGEYHRRGYATSFVERLLVTQSGTLEIHVKESRLRAVRIDELDPDEAAQIEALLMPLSGELYNRQTLRERAVIARERFNLERIRIEPVNYRGTGDVLLLVRAERKSRGRFSGALGYNPIYGISPELGYLYPGDNASYSVRARGGYRWSELRRLEGDARVVFGSRDRSGIGLVFGLEGGKRVEIWESRDDEYSLVSCAPAAGVRLVGELSGSYVIWSEALLKGSMSRIDGYDGRDLQNREACAVLDLSISNRYYIIESRNATELRCIVTGGLSDLEEKGLLSATVDFSTSFLPVHWLRLVPRLHAFAVTSGKRIYRRYVFDQQLMGFGDEFTASRWKNVASLDAEFELSPEFLYAGPFGNSGYYINEHGTWTLASAAGVKARLVYGDLSITAYYGFDVMGAVTKGSLYVYGESSF